MESKLNFGQRLSVEIIWTLCRLFSMLPLFVQYRVVAPIIRLIIYRVFRYRYAVVTDNLRHAFPERSESEQAKIRDNFYTILSEIFVSAVAIASPSFKGKFDDIDDMSSDAAKLREEVKGKNWISLCAHFGLWEHNILWGEFSDNYIIGAYHKLKSPIMNTLFSRLRTRNHKNIIVVERKQLLRFVIKNRGGIDGKNIAIGLIADQHSSRYEGSNWIDFLGRETIFFEGGEKLALKFKYPVYFIYYTRHGAGKYRFTYEKLYDGEQEVEPFEITRRYVRRLEQEIRLHPEMWLWSHRRWKHKRQG